MLDIIIISFLLLLLLPQLLKFLVLIHIGPI